MRRYLIPILVTLSFAGCVASETPPPAAVPEGENPSPYAAEQVRAIKALSAQEVDDLLNGRGMGLAKSAELNSYPGPLHALELTDALNLTDDQRERLQQLREAMLSDAVALGERIVHAEAALERAFAEGSLDEGELRERVAAIARWQGELRVVHLATHLETRALMSDHQVARYDMLRGYHDPAPGAHEGHVGHHG